jgi:hypothetical protein
MTLRNRCNCGLIEIDVDCTTLEISNGSLVRSNCATYKHVKRRRIASKVRQQGNRRMVRLKRIPSKKATTALASEMEVI